MKLLVLGSGGREHTLTYFLKKSPLVDRIYCYPGNAGTAEIAETPDLPSDDFSTLIRFAKDERIDLTVVGPESPLVEGVSDFFNEHGLAVFGPGAAPAKIEGSKIFAKELMRARGIPTADFAEFRALPPAMQHIRRHRPPYVVKADGLAGGKGVVIVQTEGEAEDALRDMFEKRVFGESGARVLIEGFLTGEEATVLALCDGENISVLPPSQDHKPVYDGDMGPNTGGMGAIAPAPVVSDAVMGRVIDRILLPLVDELSRQNIRYMGVIYAGLMISDQQDPYVVEFNCRFGDPEAEAVLPLLDTDLCEMLLRTTRGELRECTPKWKDQYCCDVVIASGGYPGTYAKGKPISGIEKVNRMNDCFVFHAGTRLESGKIVTSGGRVLNIVGTGKSLRDAVDSSYHAVELVHFDQMHYRKDIGQRGLLLLKQ
jgi:phosphoribosylamine--glycine ligase